MSSVDAVWNSPDDPEGNVQHVAEHGLSPIDGEFVLNHPERQERSRSNGRRMVFGFTPSRESQKNATLRTLQRYADGIDCELQINVVSADVTKRTKRATG